MDGCCDFTAFSTVFQTKNEGRVTVKSSVQWHTVYIGKIRSPAEIEDENVSKLMESHRYMYVYTCNITLIVLKVSTKLLKHLTTM